MKWMWLLAGALVLPSPVLAADDVRYADPPGWVRPTPGPVAPARPQGAFSILERDLQVRIDDAGQHFFESSAYRINTAEGLELGNLLIAWDPATGGPTVHKLQIVRDGEVIDVLRRQRFSILQREGGLEQSMLTGTLTAAMQIQGLRVGDVLIYEATVDTKDPTLGSHAAGALALPSLASDGTYRVTVNWTPGNRPRWLATSDILHLVKESETGLTLEMNRPEQFFPPEEAPLRHVVGRVLEFTSFADWQDVSRTFEPLYRRAAVLPRNSELREDMARIMRTHADEAGRAQAALRLVQDQVRYVYVGLNGGNLTPASVADTWERRYGDCKAKTVLLLALLREMGIAAQAVLVNQQTGGEGIDAFLPSHAGFDHVLVRATVDGKQVWLDGTRTGDTQLNPQAPELYANVLPLTEAGSDLERLPYVAPAVPQRIELYSLDASAGVDQDARSSMRVIMRGAEALQLRAALLALQPDALDQALRNLVGGEGAWAELEEVNWQFDDAEAAIIIDARGSDRIEWNEPDDYAITGFPITAAGFYPPPERRRPPQQDRSAPYVNEAGHFVCRVTTVRLPATRGSQGWLLDEEAMNRVIGGIAYWRMAELENGELRSLMSTRTLAREITAEDALAANATIPGFDNSVSNAYLRRQGPTTRQFNVGAEGIDRVPGTGDVDWLRDSSACSAPGT